MRVAVVLVVVLTCASCSPTSPSQSLSGFWIARSIGHSSQVGFTLMQSGDMITGKACAISDGVLLYKDAPVSGEYPDVQFTVAASQTQPCCANMAGTRFSGKQDMTKDIVGTYGTIDLRFERSLMSLCP